MTTDSLVSVVIPTYNRADSVCEAIDNVFEQTYKNIELIVVDDGSTDDTEVRLRAYGNRIRLVRQANAGPAAARNRGLELARGEIVAFQDSDDLWKPAKLERQLRLLERAGSDVPCCICNASFGRVKGSELTSFGVAALKLEHNEGIWMNVGEVLATRSILFNQVVAIRRRAIERLGGFDERLKYQEDYDLPLRLSALGPWAFLRDPLVIYRLGSANSYAQKAMGDPIVLKECEIAIFERALKEAIRGNNSMLQRQLTRRLKVFRRMLVAAHLRESGSAFARPTGLVMECVEHLLEVIYRRTVWYPKPLTIPLSPYASAVPSPIPGVSAT